MKSTSIMDNAEIDSERLKLLRSIEKGLDFLGESAKQSTLWYLRNDRGLGIEGMLTRPDDFVVALNRIFGLGTRFIEEKIVAQVASDFQIKEQSIPSLRDALREAHNQMARSGGDWP